MTPVEIRIRKSPPQITFLIDILQKHGRILATTPVFLQKQGTFPAENIFQLKSKDKRNNDVLNKLCKYQVLRKLTNRGRGLSAAI